MRTLRVTDGTEPHLRGIRYHSRQCRQKQGDAYFLGLQQEAEEKHKRLLQKSRGVEDSAETLVDLTADIDGAESLLEDEVRNTSDDLSKLDRQQPELGIYAKIFPGGVGGVIAPERKKQLQPALDLLERLTQFPTVAVVQDALSKIQKRTKQLKDALHAKETEEETFQKLFTQEQAIRAEIREHLVDVLARLTQRYKSNPSLAESFFIPDARSGSTALTAAENRGRVFGKIEALLSFLEAKGVSVGEEQKKAILGTREEDKIEAWLQRAFAGEPLEFAPVTP
jgi:predicted nuclease with TOPRIM domain